MVEYLGDEQLAHVRLRDHDVVVKLPVEPRLEAGSTRHFSVPLEQVRLFEAASGRALGVPTRS